MNRHNIIVATPSSNIQQYIITSHNNNNASAQYDENNATKKINEELEKHRKLSDWYYIKSNRKSQEQHQQKLQQKQHQDDDIKINNIDTMLSKGLLLMTKDDDENEISNKDVSENYRRTKPTNNNNNNNPTTVKSNKNLSGECDSTNQLNIRIFDEKFNKLSVENNMKIVPFCTRISKNDSEKESKQITLQQSRNKISARKEHIYYQFNEKRANLSRNRMAMSYTNEVNTARLVNEIDSNGLTFIGEQQKVCTMYIYLFYS